MNVALRHIPRETRETNIVLVRKKEAFLFLCYFPRVFVEDKCWAARQQELKQEDWLSKLSENKRQQKEIDKHTLLVSLR